MPHFARVRIEEPSVDELQEIVAARFPTLAELRARLVNTFASISGRGTVRM